VIDPGTLSLAENANTHSPLDAHHERIENERFVLWMGPGYHPSHNVAQRLRLTPETVDATVEEVHGILRERGRYACTWEIGSSATPSDLRGRLYARGMVDDGDPDVVAMVLASPPPPPPPGVEARPVRDADEYVEAKRVAHAAFGMPTEDPAEVERWRRNWEAEQASRRARTFVSLIDGRIVAHGTSTYTEHGVTLNGGSTAPDARGRGAYRALVSARWDDAVEHGIPVLVTQAGAMSRPILERVGFAEVARIWILLDDFTSEAPA
jgi:hypothetical protein